MKIVTALTRPGPTARRISWSFQCRFDIMFGVIPVSFHGHSRGHSRGHSKVISRSFRGQVRCHYRLIPGSFQGSFQDNSKGVCWIPCFMVHKMRLSDCDVYYPCHHSSPLKSSSAQPLATTGVVIVSAHSEPLRSLQAIFRLCSKRGEARIHQLRDHTPCLNGVDR